MKRKILAILFMVTVILTAFPFAAFADAGTGGPPGSAECLHQNGLVSYTVSSCICTETCSNRKGTGTLYLCKDCGKLVFTQDWTGGSAFRANELGNAYFDPAESKVILECTACGETFEDECSTAHIHTFEETEVVPATCAQEGHVVYTCTGCSTTVTETLEKLTVHTWDGGVVTAPTCTTVGYTTFTCTECHQVTVADYVSELGHDWDDGEITVIPNCNTVGELTHHCSRCSELNIEVLPKNDDHDLHLNSHTDPSCTAAGADVYTCSRCDYVNSVPIPAGHTWVEDGRTEPTCVRSGNIHYSCSVCFSTKNEPIEPTGVHIWELHSDSATCVESGYFEYRCESCGETKYVASPILGHDWGEWVTVTPASCTAAGLEIRNCSRGCQESRVIPKLEHQYGADYYCTRCRHTYPEVEELLSIIDDIPAVSEIGEANAMLVSTRVALVERLTSEITDPAVQEAWNHFYTSALQQKVSAAAAACAQYATFTSYEVTNGSQSLQIVWHDLNPELRVPAEDFLTASDATLYYTIVAPDGTFGVPVALRSAAEINADFAFLGIIFPAGQELLNCTEFAGVYAVATNSNLPVSFTSLYVDHSTGEEYPQTYTIRYSVEFENPDTENYLISVPATDDQTFRINCGSFGILTQYADWTANISWHDDNNRSSDGGSATTNRPRVSADVLKAAQTLYRMNEAEGISEAIDPSEYELLLDETANIITIKGLPAFDAEGFRIDYYLKQNSVPAANADVVPGNKYSVGYFNTGEYSNKWNALYSGGHLSLTLSNTVPFTVDINWVDGKTSSERPSAIFYIWRVIEEYDASDNLLLDTTYSYAVPECSVTYGVPRLTNSTFSFYRTLEGGGTSTLFPMYDAQGRRYVYFGKMKGISGNYITDIDNSTSRSSGEVIGAFQNDSFNQSFFLNGATVTHRISTRISVGVSLYIQAKALQNQNYVGMPVAGTFKLQRRGADGIWTDADYYEDEVEGLGGPVPEDGKVYVTLAGYIPEDMAMGGGSVSVRAFDANTGLWTDFRWVQTKLSVNGVTGLLDENSWQSGSGSYREYTKTINVNLGQEIGEYALTSGPEGTTAQFRAFSDGNAFTNVIVGNTQFEIRKFFYDENGVSIADSDRLADKTFTFQILQNDTVYETIELTASDLVGSGEFWQKIRTYDRYDMNGSEYRYTLQEVMDPADELRWREYPVYDTIYVDYPAGSGVLVKRTIASYMNRLDETSDLEFSVQIKWTDDSDVLTRTPAKIAIYRFRDAEGNLLPVPELVKDDILLSPANNWYQLVNIAPQNIGSGENMIPDSVSNYIAVEVGSFVKNEYYVPFNNRFDMASADIVAQLHQDALSDNIYLGVLGQTEDSGEEWDKLAYCYDAYLHIGTEENGRTQFTLENVRIGFVDVVMNVSWRVGGKIFTGNYSLKRSGVEIATFTLGADLENMQPVITNFEWKNGFDGTGLEAVPYENGVVRGSDGNYTISIIIEGLPKFNNLNRVYSYSASEISVIDSEGTAVPANGSYMVDGFIYQVSAGSSVSRSGYADHRSDDRFVCSIANTRSATFNFVSNKVWRDENQLTRPDVCFSVYRISLQDSALRELVEAGDIAGMSAYLSTRTTNEYRVIADRYWDTRINKYWWTCTIENMPMYDGGGYAYVYYGAEKLSTSSGGNSGAYKAYYVNLTCDTPGYRPINPNEEDLTTQMVFGIENDLLAPMNGNVFIFADGEHARGENDFASYYSATVVNRPEAITSIAGSKRWVFPEGFTVPEDILPTVTVNLYRSTDELNYNDFADADAYIEAILAACEEGILTSQDISSEDYYKFRFSTYLVNGEEQGLPQYDRWGSTYSYYPVEAEQWHDAAGNAVSRRNFPTEKVIYNNMDNSVVNVFSVEDDFAEVTLKKVWELSPEVAARIVEHGLQGIVPADFAPATFSLKGIPTNNGTEIDEAEFDFGKVTIDPSQASNVAMLDADGDGVIDTIIEITTGEHPTLTATYTFRYFSNTQTGELEKLPYSWIGDNPIHYYLTEESINGYESQYAATPVVFDDPVEELVEGITVRTHRNTEHIFLFTNTYVGPETVTFDFTKIWADKYVDNDAYRPNSITFRIRRRVNNAVDDGFFKDVTLYKVDFLGKSSWTGSASGLLKYAPNGKAYTYFLASETINDGGSIVTVSPDSPDKTIGNYVLTDYTDTSFTNQLKEELRTSVTASKNWSVDGTSIANISFDSGFFSFDMLRKFGVFPENVKFVLQRSTDGINFTNVAASDYVDATHRIQVDGSWVVGRSVNIAAATSSNYQLILATAMQWDNIPLATADGTAYTYRLAEIMNWNDGTVDTITGSNGSAPARGVTASYNVSGSNHSIVNDIAVKKVRIAKTWVDNHGAENTRPSSFTVTVSPVGNTGSAVGTTLTLNSFGHTAANTDSEIYYSDFFYLPSGVAIIFGEEGATYTVEETFSKLNSTDADYVRTISSDNIEAVTGEDGEVYYNLHLINTYPDPVRKTLTLTAKKTWSGDATWAELVRPALKFKLQYKEQGGTAWKDIENMADFSYDASQSAILDVPTTGTLSVTWTNMFKYWNEVSVDGKAEYIQYRVVEVPVTTDSHLSYTISSSNSTPFTNNADSQRTPSVTVTNTFVSVQINLQKKWTGNGTSLSNDTVNKLIALNALPKQITVVIEYKDAGGNWVAIPGTSEKTLSTSTLLSNTNTGFKLPRYDKNGSVIEYRLREKTLVYNEGSYTVDLASQTMGSVSTQILTFSDKSSTTNLVLTNNYTYVSFGFKKTWVDECNRDGLRAFIEMKLTRDGSQYSKLRTDAAAATLQANFCTVTKNADNTWNISWNYLPKYQSDKLPTDETLSVYVWEETACPTGYEKSYDTDDDSRTEVTNAYQPKRGSVTLQKIWSDYENQYLSRPDSIFVKLQYKNAAGSWVDVPTVSFTTVNGKTVYADSDGKDAYTTSTTGWIELTSADNWTVTWADVPMNANVSGTVKAISYRVIEGVEAEDGSILTLTDGQTYNGYKVTYTAASLTANGGVATAKVTNTLVKTKITITPVFTSDSSVYTLTRPQSVSFNIEYKKDTDSAWLPVPQGTATSISYVNGMSTVRVTAASGWTLDVPLLPSEDAYGVSYEYRLTATSISYAEGDVAVNDTLSIVGPYNLPAVIVEAAFANGSYTASPVYDLYDGSLTAKKDWQDGNDRDGGRKTVQFQLYRVNVNAAGQQVTQTVGSPVSLTAAGGWTYTWTGLPIRTNGATAQTDLSYYYVKEIGETSGVYTGNAGVEFNVTYTENVTIREESTVQTTVTNTHIPYLYNLSATVAWGNDKDKIDVRPDSVNLKLQYRIGTGEWTDVASSNILGNAELAVLTGLPSENVYILSETTGTQTVSDANEWKAVWNNLVANVSVNGTSQKVQYRVVEDTDAILNYTAQQNGISETVVYDGSNKEVIITNTLNRGALVGTPVITANGQPIPADKLRELVKELQILPESFTVTVTYMDGTETKQETGTVTFDETTNAYSSYTFTDLPLADAAGNPIHYTLSDSAVGYDFIDYATEDVTLSGASTSVTLVNNYAAGSLEVEGSWVDDNDRDGGRPDEVTVEIYRDGEKIDEQTLNAAGSWTAVVDYLPVYADAKVSNARVASVYSIKEVGETSGKLTGENGVLYDVSYSASASLTAGDTASQIVTNTHEIYTGSLTVTTSWDDEENKYGSRPDSVTYELWYSLDGGTTWTKVPASGTEAYTASTNPNTVSASAAGYTWTGLPVNYGGTPILYKVTEEAIDGYKPAVFSPVSAVLAESSGSYSAAVTANNELITTELHLTDDRENADYLELDKVVFVVEYQHGDSAWIEAGEMTVNAGETETVFAGIPLKDGSGNDYRYRVREKSLTFLTNGASTTVPAGGSYGNDAISWTGYVSIYDTEIDGEKTSEDIFDFTAVSTIAKASMLINKEWIDDNNRDGGRTDSVVIEIYRDGIKFTELTLNASNSWTAEAIKLPVYTNTSGTAGKIKSYYTVKEVGVTGGKLTGKNGIIYTASYSGAENLTADEQATVTVTNEHAILTGTVTVNQSWNDSNNKFHSRPDTTTYELSYSIDGGNTWIKVTADDPVCFTGSTNPATVPANGTGCSWTGLPVNYNGAPILYKVTEEDILGYTTPDLAPVTLTENSGEYAAVVDAVNELITTQLKITDDREEADYLDVTGVTFTVEFWHEGYGWVSFGDVTIGEGEDTVTVSGLPLTDGNGNEYRYRVSEKSLTYDDDGTDATVSGSGSFGSDEITWTGFVSIYDTTVTGGKTAGDIFEFTAASAIAKTDADVKVEWCDDRNRDGGRYDYVVVELYRDGVKFAEKTVSAPLLNMMKSAMKSSGPALAAPAPMPVSTEWRVLFEDLPVYTNTSGASGRVKSVYTIKEVGETDGKLPISGTPVVYDVEYLDGITLEPGQFGDIKVTNTHRILAFSIDATTLWLDNLDTYGIRPLTSALKLQYSFDPASGIWVDVDSLIDGPDAEYEEGTSVTTVSALLQTLTSADAILPDGSQWGTVRWDELPAYALVSSVSTKIYYRVVEDTTDLTIYDVTIAEPVSYTEAAAEADLTVSCPVVNALAKTAELNVNSSWVDNENNELDQYIGKEILVQLQYRESETDSWKNVPLNGTAVLDEDGEWKYTFSNLPGGYDYRCIAIEIGYEDGSNAVTGSVTIDDGFDYEAVLGVFITESKTEKTEGATEDTFTSTITNTLVPYPATGDGSSLTVWITVLGISLLSMTAVIVRRRKEECF